MKTLMRLVSVVVCFMMLSCFLAVGLEAVTVLQESLISTYTVDFENNYFSELASVNCSYAKLTDHNGGRALDFIVRSNANDHRFELYNSQNGVLTLKNGRVYAVTVNYKVERIGNENDEATSIALVRYNGQNGELVKIKPISNVLYYRGDTTDWVSSTVVFKASISDTDVYDRLAINVVSGSCSEEETNIESRTTSILFDDITVTECTDDTKSIEFMSNGGEVCSPILGNAGQTIELPTPHRDLYVFKGWYTDIKLTAAFKKNAMPNSLNTKLYAKWDYSDEAVVIDYITNGGSLVETSVGRANDVLSLPTSTRNGFHFAGWYDKNYKTRYDLTSFPDESTKLYAKWEPIPQLCSFENKETFPEPTGSAVSKRFEISDASAQGGKYSLYYDFWKAYPESAGKTGFARCILRDEVGEYIRVEDGKTYTVTFKYKVVGVDEVTKMGNYFGLVTSAKGSAWTSPTLQMEYYDGYKYSDDVGKGWKNCTINFIAKSQSKDSNYLSFGVGGVTQVYIDEIFVYEYDKVFKPQGNGMMLCFDSQGGPTVDTVYAERGESVTLPVPTREGYTFGGWSYDQLGMEPVGSDTLKLDKVYTKLYAEWFEDEPLTDDTPTVDTEPEPTPQPEGEPKPEPEPESNSNVILWVVIISASAFLAAAVVTVAVVAAKRKLKK